MSDSESSAAVLVKKKQFNNKGILVFNQNEENLDPNLLAT
jgi:hypothetical protein